MSWTGGVHVEGTPIWCDAQHARDVGFASHAGVPGAHRHRQLICTAETLALIEAAQRRKIRAVLTPPLSRPFSLGDVRVELCPTGYRPGAAACLVEAQGRRVFYLGSVAAGVGSATFLGQLRPCDVLVVDGRYAAARFRFPQAIEAAAALDALVHEALAAGAAPVLLVEPATTAFAVAAHLGAGATGATGAAGAAALTALTVVAHRSIVAELRFRRSALPAVPWPALRRVGRAPRPGEILLWPVAQAAALARVLPADKPARIVLVDGSAAGLEAEALARAGAHAGVAWADRAGHEDLVQIVAQTGAHEIHLLDTSDAGVADLAAAVGRGAHVRALGPPRQLDLF